MLLETWPFSRQHTLNSSILIEIWKYGIIPKFCEYFNISASQNSIYNINTSLNCYKLRQAFQIENPLCLVYIDTETTLYAVLSLLSISSQIHSIHVNWLPKVFSKLGLKPFNGRTNSKNIKTHRTQHVYKTKLTQRYTCRLWTLSLSSVASSSQHLMAKKQNQFS